MSAPVSSRPKSSSATIWISRSKWAILCYWPASILRCGRRSVTPSTCACGRRNAWRLRSRWLREQPLKNQEGVPYGQECRRFRGTGKQVQDREGNAVYPLGEGRRPRHYPVVLCAEPAHRRAETLGAPRRQRRVPQSRRLAHLERLLRDGNPAGQKPGAAPPALRGDDPGAERPRLDHGVERRRRPHHLRVEGRRAVRDSVELPPP